MQNRILLLIVIILSIAMVLISSSSENTTFFNTYAKSINVKDVEKESINKMNLEDYIIGVVAAEMPASFEDEALKAQAIASRTYATYKIQTSNKNYDVVTDVSNQSYITIDEMKLKWKDDFDKYYNKIKNSVLATKGKVMLYNGEVVEAYYFAMSNGYTEESKLVFNEEKDYLKSVVSSYDNKNLKNFEVTNKFSEKEICEKLNLDCNNIVFQDIKRSNTNRVNTIKINNIEYKGTDFRHKLNLRSTDFDILKKDNYVYITTRGFGHGVGMSQYGAQGLALKGYNYEEILEHFYKNIKISII